ncbi:hypothetical protein SLEP1_g48365 [Rubroshorea leprosula]|uniref:OTU domain-containing protein n=1 Tax=Rubroshorea leprosula TaxID=152421 RepID=A0AAV5LW93_9ROSI|nr:hypothetical protein SLEP1_g48365 [Rubroshorea leprosula]
MADDQGTADKPPEANLSNTLKKQETHDEMLSSHRKEISDLQKKEIEMKKAAAKGSKAEQKAKKKQLGFLLPTSLTIQSPARSAKRRAKRAQQEAAREQRIQEEQNNIVSERMIEDEKLVKKLEPFGLTINEIKPDGHCLYRAVEDQLTLLSGGSSLYTHQQELREMVAGYMRKHMSDFLPFFLSENMKHENADNSPAERFENYCKEVESTAAWGGQLELGA